MVQPITPQDDGEESVTSTVTRQLYFENNYIRLWQDADETYTHYDVFLKGYYNNDVRDLTWNTRQAFNLSVNKSGVGDQTSENLRWNGLLDFKYFISNSPYFLQSRLLANQSKTLHTSVDNQDVASTIYLGTGLGRVWDLAKWRRGKRVEDLLLSEGFLIEKLTRPALEKVIDILSTATEPRVRLENLITFLDSQEVLAMPLSAKIAMRLQEVIESSVASLPSGFQISGGITQELTTRVVGAEKQTNGTIFLEYYKPFGIAWLFEFPVSANFNFSSAGDKYHVALINPAFIYDTDVEKFSAGYNAMLQFYENETVFTDQLLVKYSHNIIGQLFAGGEFSLNGIDIEGDWDWQQTDRGLEWLQGESSHAYGFNFSVTLSYYIFR